MCSGNPGSRSRSLIANMFDVLVWRVGTRPSSDLKEPLAYFAESLRTSTGLRPDHFRAIKGAVPLKQVFLVAILWRKLR